MYVIVGPTATGKSDYAVALAKKVNGEVVSADSRQVYRGLDIGSGKITQAEMQSVPHHMLDIADPMQVYTAQDFARDASAALEDILRRGKTPIVVGGTGFYIDALFKRVTLPEVPVNPALRKALESKSAAELFDDLQEKDPRRAKTIDQHNKVRLVRALEIVDALGAVPEQNLTELPYSIHWIGLDWPDEVLKERIKVRLEKRFDGIVTELKTLIKNGVSHERLDDLGLEYRYVSRYVRGLINKDACITELEKEIWHYAKRQRTYFKKNKDIRWIRP